ncbi:MAG: hypothetical protein ABR975_12270 [Vulcanimicrobiaceae bacterium]
MPPVAKTGDVTTGSAATGWALGGAGREDTGTGPVDDAVDVLVVEVAAACAVTADDAGAASAASASRRMLSGVGAGVAPACSASELCPAIIRIGCPWSPFVTLVTRPASCRNLVTRADALSAFVSGGPVFAALIAALNACVSFAFAAAVEIPSADARDDAIEFASFVTTSLADVPASRRRSICACRSASSEVVAVVAVDAVVVVVLAALLLADARETIEPSSWLLNVESLPIALDATVCLPAP